MAFSGEVNDPESGPDPFKETSKELNPNLNGREIREAFKLPEHHILLVANKFQTGFDQPLLCGMYVDRRLAGIQAVQTLSRLNRAYPGKDTTYVLDFVNSSDEILTAFRTYYQTAELADVTDPNLVFDLRAKLDATGHYDEFEVERVVKVELDEKAKQGDLIAAIHPVADRLLKSYKGAQLRWQNATEAKDEKATKDAQDEMNALLLFKNDMGAFLRLYSFLSQIFDYGNTAIEARSIFYRRLIPLLDFGRQREGVDVSKIVLTHHRLYSKGKTPLVVNGESEKLPPITETGSGSVQEKEKALLAEIVAKLNDLFQGDVTDDDQLVYVNNVIKGKLLESETLAQQAANNSKEQFSSSPDLPKAILDAIMDALDAHTTMSNQALSSKRVQQGLKDVLLGPGQLYELLRKKGGCQEAAGDAL
ncbi:Type I site-specific restriction-modification system, R (Restriction) subunit and related helicase (fragment) [Candidatus Filomicrobium marinum]|uniref:Type I site-specific restriction-modification system, R (Restriction) subunit and related helicase n=1 Tax=Candidatus Filomicrobium marinum TaxID=1608628 RepID=A0A0D6JED7_9HYPH